MKEAFAIAVISGLLVSALGIQGCSPGTVIWAVAKDKRPATPFLTAVGRGAPPRPTVAAKATKEDLSEHDRDLLAKLIAKYGE